MKLEDAAKYLREVDDEDRKRPPPVKGGGTISTAQAASILGVTVSRVRQLIGQGKLKPTVKPRKGDRDHELLKKDVDDLAVRMDKKSGKSQEKDDSKDGDDDNDSKD